MRHLPSGEAPAAARSAETSSQELGIVHLKTGELISDLEAQEPDVLAEMALLLRERERELRAMRQALELELGARLERRPNPRKVWVLDDFEVKSVNRREWDAAELEGTLEDLLERGLISPRDAQGVLKREVTVGGAAAARLCERLGGEALAAVKACFTWRQRGVEIARAIPLLPPQD